MSRTKRSFWKVSLSVFASVSHETLLLEDCGVRFCECLVRNAHFGRSLCQCLRMSRTKRAFCKDILEERSLKPRRNADFGRFFPQFLRMSRMKRSFCKVSLSVFANVSHETLLLEDCGVRFCECLVRNAHFGRSLCQFLRMSRTKRAFWKDILEERGLKPRRNADFGRFFSQFLRMSRTKRSFWKIALPVFANVSYETLILEGHFGGKGSET